MTRTLLLLFLTLLFTSSQPTESAEFDFPLEEGEVPIPSDVNWAALDLSTASTNPQIQGLLIIGVQSSTQQAVEDGALPSGTYSVVQVNSIEENLVVADAQIYRFNVDVSNGQGQTDTIIFEITYVPLTGESYVSSYSIPGQETEQELETETEQFSPFEEEMLEGYVPLDLDQASTDIQIQGLLQISVKNVTEQAIQNGSLPDGDYRVTQINSIEQNMNIIDAEEYRFDVNISSRDNNPPSNLIFEIMYYPILGTSQVTSYSISNKFVTIPDVNNFTNTTNPGNTSNITGLPEGYTPIDTTSSEYDKAKNVAEYGLFSVTSSSMLSGQLFTLTGVNGMGKKVEEGIDYYWFDVNVANTFGNTARLVFILWVSQTTGALDTVEYNLYVT